MSKVLEIKDINAGYNHVNVINNITFDLLNGEILAVIGQNGCGKSTLLKTIARMINQTSGNIIYEGITLNKKNTWDLRALGITWFVQGGMIFQTLTVKEHFELSLKGRKNSREILDECLAHFPDLRAIFSTKAGNLSGGQKQMLSFAMLLAQQSRCWLLDEPTAGLSPEAVQNSLSFLNKIKQGGKISMILVEHNYSLAFNLADKVAIIKDGGIINGFTKEIFQQEDFLIKHLYN